MTMTGLKIENGRVKIDRNPEPEKRFLVAVLDEKGNCAAITEDTTDFAKALVAARQLIADGFKHAQVDILQLASIDGFGNWRSIL